MKKTLIAAAAIAALASCAAPPPPAPTPSASVPATRIEMTWMSIANWYFKVNDKRILMDGYVTRLPESIFYPPPALPNDLYAYTKVPAAVDIPAITKVRDVVVGTDKLDYLLVGHSHWDHSWDTPAWSRVTGAPMIGGASTCMQAVAQNVAPSQCRSVSGGEKIDLGNGITMRVVRWNHSGDASNPIQHFPRELYRPPVPDPTTGGLRAGVGEDYPNGGGNRAYLFTVDGPDGRLSFFVNNSASAFDLTKPIYVDGVDYGSPLGNLQAAMKDAGLTQVDAWIGTGGRPVAELVVPVLRPKVYLPSHWDGLFNPFWPGMPYPFKDDALVAYLAVQQVRLVPENQYFDKFVLTRNGVTTEVNHEVKSRLGFSDTQAFKAAMVDAVDKVASTSVGDDCGEGFKAPSAWSMALAALNQAKH